MTAETLAQIAALVVFVAMFAFIIVGRVHRFVPALVGAGLTLVVVFLVIQRSPQAAFNVLNFRELGESAFWLPRGEELVSHGVNWQTIIFIAGMMVMVEGLGEAGFFRWLCLLVAKLVNYRVVPVFVSFLFLSAFLAMFIDSITVLLFLASVTVEMARLLKFDPVPLIIGEIFAANAGGAATVSGNPPNIIVGTAFGYTFTDFVANTGPIAWATVVAAIIFFYFFYRKSLTRGIAQEQGTVASRFPQPAEAIHDRRTFYLNAGVFILMILLLVTHAQTGLSVALIGAIVAVLSVVVAGKSALSIIKKVDWRTLLFFLGLFVTVSGLEETGVLEVLADWIGRLSGGNLSLVVAIIVWASAILSAIVDNIPFAATMVPVIASLSQTQGFALPTLSWTMVMGANIGGNATPIGASANVVGTAIAEREGHPIGWGRFLKATVPITVITVALSWLLLQLRYVW